MTCLWLSGPLGKPGDFANFMAYEVDDVTSVEITTQKSLPLYRVTEPPFPTCIQNISLHPILSATMAAPTPPKLRLWSKCLGGTIVLCLSAGILPEWGSSWCPLWRFYGKCQLVSRMLPEFWSIDLSNTLILPPATCVALVKSLNLSEPQFLHLDYGLYYQGVHGVHLRMT